MHKNTLVLIAVLASLASLLFGVSIGKKLERKQVSNLTNLPTSNIITPTSQFTFPTSISTSTEASQVVGISSYTDDRCGFSLTYPSSFSVTKTAGNKGVIIADVANPNSVIAATCDTKLPRPPVSENKIEETSLDGIVATLYHDQSPDGSSRDEVIVKHPRNGLEIILAGFGPDFQNALSSFKFTQ